MTLTVPEHFPPSAPVDPARLYVLADQLVRLPVVALIIVSERPGPCIAGPHHRQRSCCTPPPGDAYVVTRDVEGEVRREPSCATCLSRQVQDALDDRLAVWVEIPAVVTP